MTSSLAPFLIFYAGAGLAAVTRGMLRQILLLAIPIVGAINLVYLGRGDLVTLGLFDYDLILLRVDKLSLLFGIVFHIAAFLGLLFALHVKDTTQHVSGILYAGSSIGAVFAGDLITLFIFWEMTAITSVFLILARKSPNSQATGMRYLIIQVLSGVILLAGVLVRYQQTGSIEFTFIGLDGPGGALILLAFGIKAAFPLLHSWLTDAYPEATPTGTIFLSAFTTKLAVYTLARGYPGTEILIYVGATMTAFPIFYAVIENDLRKVLSYSLINQVGFMVCGIGIGTELALNGAVSHAFAHIIYKALLFMSMGAVLFRTGKINGTDLGGLYKSMPLTSIFCIIGAASISAFPLFSGFVAKSMVLAAAVEEGHPIVWMVLLFASAGVFHHSGIKIPFFAFFAHDSGIRCKEAPGNMLAAMFVAAFLCIAIGVYPWPLYGLLPFAVNFDPYTAGHVLAQAQLLFFSALAFTYLKLSGLYPPEMVGVNIDAEWSYRRLLPRAVNAFVATFGPIDHAVRHASLRAVQRLIVWIFRHHGPEGVLAATVPSGAGVLGVVSVLAVFLILYFFT